MTERAELIACIRGEIVGPSRSLTTPSIAVFNGKDFMDRDSQRRGALGWEANPGGEIEEVLYFSREAPHTKYGVGLLHPAGTPNSTPETSETPTDLEIDSDVCEDSSEVDDNDIGADDDTVSSEITETDGDEFEVTSIDIRHPSTIGLTFYVSLESYGRIIVRLPQTRAFAWQSDDDLPFPLNGRYERTLRCTTDEHGQTRESPMWRRRPAVLPDTLILIDSSDLDDRKSITRDVVMPEDSPINLQLKVYARRDLNKQGFWLVTIVLCNVTCTDTDLATQEGILYQTYFDVSVDGGCLKQYPESPRPFNRLDPEEQSLALLYRESATWGIGHGCAAGWDAEPGQFPNKIYADVMPAVEIPSMTPDIMDEQGNPVKLSMRILAELTDNQTGNGWLALEKLADEYAKWIAVKRKEVSGLPAVLQAIAGENIDACEKCLDRINGGITLLRDNQQVRNAFRLANLSMLLQQIAAKQLSRRSLHWDKQAERVMPEGVYQAPWDIYEHKGERADIGQWRAFQIAFLLMSLSGVSDGKSTDREIVDLIWFPTGGGKTEAYLAVMAFYMVHQRLMMQDGQMDMDRDGTNILMRYTLRMLTTQQFQRAASLVCAMEFLRRNPEKHGITDILGKRFSLGLWIGRDSSPNKIENAKQEVERFRRGEITGNPLVLTECPWCRAEIGRYEGNPPPGIPAKRFNHKRIQGISDEGDDGPLLLCPDSSCAFGKENPNTWIPVEVVDERIYKQTPSLIIATADKYAMIAYRPDAGAIFGRNTINGEMSQTHIPPGLIIQDELHLISGPLGTMYALYEGIFERLCSHQVDSRWIKPKIIASTATIRGAAEQVRALYARNKMQLFPSPGLLMGDSFFGKYARNNNMKLRPGRLYLGIHATDYGSILTTQVRTFATALFRPYAFDSEVRDPWWTLLAFYNSIRELGGAKTLFDSDIQSRLRFLFDRENYPYDKRRFLKPAEELTGRRSQAEIVAMMDSLSSEYSPDSKTNIDSCLASSIIEVGVDIERLTLMGVVGQPKTTAQYIQVTGRAGRKWPGLIMMIYNPSKSRDRSHFEQFHSYHRRLYERVEPTSATPFALSAIQRALPGALILWARLHSTAGVNNYQAYKREINTALGLLHDRCKIIQQNEELDQERSLRELDRVCEKLKEKWQHNPQQWEHFPPKIDGEYLMLWPGQYATLAQKERGTVIASNMRQVDGSAELTITQGYVTIHQLGE